jgi:hypothetical protein
MDCFWMNYNSISGISTKQIIKNITYIVVEINRKNSDWYKNTDLRYESGNYIFGACVPNFCNADEYKQMYYYLNNVTSTSGNLLNEDNIFIYPFNNYNVDLTDYKIYIYFIPCYLAILFGCFSWFNSIPAFIFSPFFKKKKVIIESSTSMNPEILSKKLEALKDSSNFDISKTSDNRLGFLNEVKYLNNSSSLNKFKNCFSLSDNIDELLNLNNSHKTINNEEGLSIMRGLRGLVMMFTVLGFAFNELFAGPVKIYCQVSFRLLVSNYSFVVLLIGLRVGPYMLYAISAYILAYKMLCFLDGQLEDINYRTHQNSINKETQQISRKARNTTKSINSIYIF